MAISKGRTGRLIELSEEIAELVGDGLAQCIVIGGPENPADIAPAEPDSAAWLVADRVPTRGSPGFALPAVTRLSLAQPVCPPNTRRLLRVINDPVSRGNGLNAPTPCHKTPQEPVNSGQDGVQPGLETKSELLCSRAE
jgi:hypothetical protein